MVRKKPLPRPNPDDRIFWEGCRGHQLRFQRCRHCGLVRWPPNIICPQCYSDEANWIVASGKGKVYTYAVYHQAFHPAFDSALPYVVAVVKLDEGPQFLTNIVDCSTDKISCDMPVRVTWEDITDEFSLPKFKPI